MKKLNHIFLTLLLFVALAACSDNSTGTKTDRGTPPEIPSFENVQPDLSFFNQNAAGSNQALKTATDNYNEARMIVGIGRGYYTAAFFQSIYIAPLFNVAPEFIDGRWEWMNTITSQDQGSVTVRLSVAVHVDGNDWVLYISGDDGEGTSYENHILMRGRVADEGKEGEWTFNALDEKDPAEVPLAKTTWKIVDETQQKSEVDIFDTDTGEIRATVAYTEDQPDFSMVITDFSFEDGLEQLIVEWNSDTNNGSFSDTEKGTERCWNGSLQDTPC